VIRLPEGNFLESLSQLDQESRNSHRLPRPCSHKAGVVTNKAEGKYAGLHDLRRAFCTRWARLVMPAVLRRLARHSSIATTLAYYVDLDAAEVADELWAKHAATPGTVGPGNKPGNNQPRKAENAVLELADALDTSSHADRI